MANYSEMTSKELRNLCKENGIAYNVSKDGKKHTMTKDEMVNALYDFEEANGEVVEAEVVESNPVEEVKITEKVQETSSAVEISENTPIEDLLKTRDEIDAIIKRKAKVVSSAMDKLNNRSQRDARNEQYDENWSMYGGVNPYTFIHTRNKERYIEEAEVGTLIAFLDETGKPRTAALVNRKSEKRVVKVKTEYDWEFIISYDDILWVKKGDKWAYGVYRILKGYNPNGKCGSSDSNE